MTTNPTLIFLPMLVVIALTFVAFVNMVMARGKAMKAGYDINNFRAHLGEPEPEHARTAVRHYGNLFELPTLFYAVCITAFAIGTVSKWTLILAWGYAATRVVQSLVHMTYNNVAHRGGAFMLGVLLMLALWIHVAIAIFARV